MRHGHVGGDGGACTRAASCAIGSEWRQESITGSLFTGWLTAGHDGALIPHMRGTAFVTGEATLRFDPHDPSAAGSARVMTRRRPDAIVVGAGIVGAACAAALARDGLRVLVLDRGRSPRCGTTAAGMGHLVVMDDSPEQLALTRVLDVALGATGRRTRRGVRARCVRHALGR